VARFRDTRGNLTEPLWYANLCLVGCCDDRDELAFAWSSGYPKYSYAETKAKLDHARAASGPTTCTHFHSLDQALCAACRWWGKIKSPAQLGHPTLPGETPPAESLPALFSPYFWRGHKLAIEFENKEGQREIRIIYAAPVVVIDFARGESEIGRSITVQHWLPYDGWTNSKISLNSVDTKVLMAQFMRVGINVHPENYNGFKKYIHAAIDRLTGSRKTSMDYDQMGWKEDDSFVLGNRLFMPPEGDSVEVEVSPELRFRADKMQRQGTREGWSLAANALFQPGFEGQAFALLCSFAAPLMRFLRSSGGIIVHQVSPTGQGKSMGLRAAWTVWGAEHAIDLNRTDTWNARFAEIALLRHLPLVFDEIQERDEQLTKDFVMCFSEGRQKSRLDRNSKMMNLKDGWSTVLISASNRSLAQMVLSKNEQAHAARVLEYASVLPEGTDPKKGAKLEKAFEANRGWAGWDFIEGLVQPKIREWVTDECIRQNEKYIDQLGRGTEHRFYSHLLACCHVAGWLLNEWEMLEFDVNRIVQFALAAALTNRTAILDNLPNYPRVLQRFLYNNIRSTLMVEMDRRYEDPLLRPQGDVLAIRIERRSMYGYIDRQAVRDWATKYNIKFSDWEKDLVAKGVIEASVQKNLGQGTTYGAAGMIDCWRVNLMSRALGNLELIKSGYGDYDTEEARDARERL